MPPIGPTAWTYEDDALFYTTQVLAGLLAGVRPQPIPRTIALMSPTDNLVASGPFSRFFFGTSGDGSYSVMRTSRGSSAFTVGFSMIHNQIRKQGAKRAVTPQWRPLDQGLMHLSMDAFYFQADEGVLPFAYEGIDYAQMVARNIVEFGGTADSGNNVRYRVTSPWSEMSLVLWSLARKVPHPHLLTLFPPDWQAKVRARGLASCQEFRTQ